jgi:hypothetical protein
MQQRVFQTVVELERIRGGQAVALFRRFNEVARDFDRIVGRPCRICARKHQEQLQGELSKEASRHEKAGT